MRGRLPWILGIHGGPDVGGGYLRAHLPTALPDGVRLEVPDLRGCGRAPDLPTGGPVMDVFVGDLAALLDGRGAPPVVLAHSFGALVALRLVLARPARVAGLVLVDPDPPVREAWEEGVAELDRRTGPAARARLAELDAGGRWRRDPAAAEAYLRLRMRPYVADAEHADGLVLELEPSRLAAFGGVGDRVRRELGGWDLRPLLPRVAPPSLVVAGARSVFPPRAPEAWARGLPDATLRVLDGAGHFPFLEAPEAFREAVGAFLGAR